MKKKIISLAAVAIVAVAAVVGVSKNANKVELSGISLANVEALAMDIEELHGDYLIVEWHWCGPLDDLKKCATCTGHGLLKCGDD